MKPGFADRFAITVAQNMIQTIKAYGQDLEPWELEHIESYAARLDEQKPLSQSQAKTLRQIHMRRVKSKISQLTGD